MTKDKISLAELSLRHKVNKSKLRFYVDLGFLKPIGLSGKKQLFDVKDATNVIGEIFRLKERGLELPEIEKKLKERKLI